jgi:6-phosphogluconate dehydrogenase
MPVTLIGEAVFARCLSSLSVKGLLEVVDKLLLVALEGLSGRSGEDLGSSNSLLLDLDAAGQKGTGKWTAIDALDKGMPVTLIGEAVFARCLSHRQCR